MSASDRHNELAPRLLVELIKGTQGESEAMVVLESVVLGVLKYYRPNVRQATEFLDSLTDAVIARMTP